MRLGVLAGRPFRRDRADAEGAIVLSEAATRLLGIAENPLGETVDVRTMEGMEERTVIGVVADVHNASLHEPIQALAFVLRPGQNRTALVRLAPGRVEAGLEALEATWTRFLPEFPFTFEFLDDRIEAQYRTERRTAHLFSLFAGLAIFIACLGLFGLAAFTAEQRTKEIGIRKVLGASVASLALLLSKDFARLVLVAFALAAPLAYLAMRRWLEDFAYRVEIGPGVFLLAGGLALLVALATVSFQAVRAALADPVESLRYE